MVRPCDVDKKLIRVAVGVLVDQPRGSWRVLITQRPGDKVLGGYWEFPGGKIALDETPSECVVREFVEELGLEVRVGPALTTIRHQYAHGEVCLYPYFCAYVGGQPQCLEVVQYRWVEPDELSAYPFPEANQSLIKEVARRLKAASDWPALWNGKDH